MRHRSFRRDVWVVVLFVFLAACGTHRSVARRAGPLEATVRGEVKDAQGGLLPGVTVTAIVLATGETRQTTTDEQGRYQLVVPARPIRLSADLPGFKTRQLPAIEPKRRQVVEWRPTLDVGAVTEMIEVVSIPAELQPSSASVGKVVVPPLNLQPGIGQPVVGHDPLAAVRRPSAPGNREGYEHRADNDFLQVAASPLSTFSVDVDRASYANVRRFLTGGGLPPADAVRIEEMVNYFPYDYAAPTDGAPFAPHLEIAPAPWKPAHLLLRVGLKARDIERAKRPASNLVFLIDVSGSMDQPNKLPLVQRALGLLVEQLDERDRVSIVVYAGAAGLVLPPTSGDRKTTILNAIDRLSAGGSTNGGQGIQLAYDIAIQNRIDGANRVILATDGDFNVGVSDQGSLVRLVQDKARQGVFLSVLGFGMGNYQDGMLEALADKGDGNYAYIDTFSEARKAFIDELTATLVTVAKDVKIQIEFNPERVRSYRLIGYENRLLQDEDFGDDAKDAGEVGAGHAVTALYELVPAGAAPPSNRSVDPLAYSRPRQASAAARSGEWLRLKLRYKAPQGGESQKVEWAFADAARALDDATPDFQFAAAVAGFGMLLRDSPHKGAATPEMVLGLGERGRGHDRNQYRAEFLEIVRGARPHLAARSASARR